MLLSPASEYIILLAFSFPVSLLMRLGVKNWEAMVRKEKRKEGEEKAEKGGQY